MKIIDRDLVINTIKEKFKNIDINDLIDILIKLVSTLSDEQLVDFLEKNKIKELKNYIIDETKLKIMLENISNETYYISEKKYILDLVGILMIMNTMTHSIYYLFLLKQLIISSFYLKKMNTKNF